MFRVQFAKLCKNDLKRISSQIEYAIYNSYEVYHPKDLGKSGVL